MYTPSEVSEIFNYNTSSTVNLTVMTTGNSINGLLLNPIPKKFHYQIYFFGGSDYDSMTN